MFCTACLGFTLHNNLPLVMNTMITLKLFLRCCH